MRILATWLALVVLLGGMLVPCPVCERAEAAAAPPDAHACCERTQAGGDATESGPAEQDSRQSQDCDRVALLHTLAALQSEQPVTSLLAAHDSLPGTHASLPVVAGNAPPSDILPPGSFTLSSGLAASPQDTGALILPLRL